MAYDVEGARKAGYTEDQIADDMADAAGIDAAAARKSGYTTEILMRELLALPAAAAEPEPPPGARGEQAEKWGIPQGGPAASPTSPKQTPSGPPFDPNAPNRVIGAAAEGWERGSHPLTPEYERAVDESGALGRFVYNPLLRAVTGVPSAILRGGQQLVQETVGGVTGSPGLGREAAALPEAFPTGIGGMRPPVRAPVRAPEAPPPAPGRFVHEVYGEPNPFAQQFGPPPPPAAPGFVPPGTASPPGGTLPRILEIIREDERVGAEKPAMIPPRTTTDVEGVTTPIQQPKTNAFAPEEPPQAAAPPPPPPGGAPPPPGGAPPPPGAPGAPNAFAPPKTPTTAAEAKAVASGWYKIHEDAGGAALPVDFADSFVDRVQTIGRQTEAGKIVGGDTEITKLIERANRDLRGERITLQAAQEMDEALGDLIDKEYGPRGMSKAGYALEELQQTLREMIDEAAPAGDPGAAGGVEALTKGRKAWSQYRKMDEMERIERRAAMGEQPTTEVRRMLRALLANDRRIRGFSEVERAALKKAADRGRIGELMHTLGGRLTAYTIGGTSGLFGGGPLGTIAGIYAGHQVASKARDIGIGMQAKRMQKTKNLLGSSVPMPNAFAPPP